MALTDSASVAVLSRIGSEWEMLSAAPECPDMGWDVLQCVFVRDYGANAKTAVEVAADWPLGRRPIPGAPFWTVRRAPQRLGGNVWQLQVTAHGDAGNRPLKHRVTSSSSSRSISGVTVGPPYLPATTLVANGTLKESSPVLEVSYILIGSEAATETLGRPGAEYQTPPVNIPVRPSPWTYLTQFTLNFPAGWNKDTMDVDRLSGTDTPVSLVQETWTHQHLITPNG